MKEGAIHPSHSCINKRLEKVEGHLQIMAE